MYLYPVGVARGLRGMYRRAGWLCAGQAEEKRAGEISGGQRTAVAGEALGCHLPLTGTQLYLKKTPELEGKWSSWFSD